MVKNWENYVHGSINKTNKKNLKKINMLENIKHLIVKTLLYNVFLYILYFCIPIK